MEGREQRKDHLIDLTTSRWGRRILFAVLYLSEGAPIGFLWWALPAKLRSAGVPVDQITALTAAITLPWVFKFVWAPLVDVLRSRRFGLRQWILLSQLVMGLCLLPLAQLEDLAAHYQLVYALLLVHAFAASTQDVAIDAWAITVTPQAERGALNGSMQVGKFLGRWLFGAGLLLASGILADRVAVGALIGVVWGSAVLVLLCREPELPAASSSAAAGLGERLRGFNAALLAAFARKDTALGLGIALVSGAGFEALGAVAGPLLVDRGFEPPEVGRFYTFSVAAMIAGSFAGGVLVDRIGKRRAVKSLLLLIAIQVWTVASIEHWSLGTQLLFAAMVSTYLGYGMFIAASYSLFMDLTDRRLGATQFSAYMGATNACESWSAWATGVLAVRVGYAWGLGALAAASLIALPLLAGLRAGADPRGRGRTRCPASSGGGV